MDQADPTRNAKPGVGTASTNSKKKNEPRDIESKVPVKSKQPQGARKRVSQACDKCRSRKDKCDGARPACSTCVTHGRTCSYDANVRKRGLPEGYVRAIEKLWGLTIREFEGVEDEILSVFTGDETNNTLLSIWRNEDGQSDSLAEVWRKSQLAKELERLLPILEPGGSGAEVGKRKRLDSDAQVGKRPGLSGAFAQSNSPVSMPDLDFQSQMSDQKQIPRATEEVETPPAIGSSSREAVNSDSNVKPQYGSMLNPAYMPASLETNTKTILPELPAETWHLLDVYFSYTHSWLPIVEKHDLLRISYQYSQVRNIDTEVSGDHALLWAAVAYAKFQHKTSNSHAQAPISQALCTAERLYCYARALIPNEEGPFDLGHVQALLILTLTNLGLGHLNRAWMLVGQAVRIAIAELGLDQLNPSKNSSRSKHVFLGCFALDTLIAARLSKRPHLRSDDLDRVGMLVEDGLEEWDPWTDCLTIRKSASNNSRVPASILSTFNRLVQVLQILNDATCASDKDKTVQFSTGLLERLHAWSRSQSQSLYFDSSAMNGEQAASLLPHQYHLHIAFFTTFATCQLLSHGQRKESPDLEPCTRSARQVVHLFKRNLDTFGLSIIPPTFEYYTKTVYDVVHAVRRSIENTHIVLDDWKFNLDMCVSAMEPAWPVFEASKDATGSVQTLKHRRESQAAFEFINGMVSTTAETPQAAKTPNSTSYEISQPYTPQVVRSQSMNSIDVTRPNRSALPFTSSMVPPTSHSNHSFGGSIADNFPSTIPESPHSTYNGGPSISNPWSMNHQNRTRHHSTNQIPLGLSQTLESPRSQQRGLPDTDGDSIFNDFAVMDAMEWTNSMDQSLVNLGFEDPDKRNQDFYAFCREPDPLYSNNNIFQQLLANSSVESESSNALSVQGFGNPGMAISATDTMFSGGIDYADGDEGIEAGQILQALSAHEGQRKSSGANG